jgi:hypothetical protein
MLTVGAVAIVIGGCATGSATPQPTPSASPTPASTPAEAIGQLPASKYPQAARVVVDDLAVRAGPGVEHPILERGEADMGVGYMVPIRVSADAVVLVLEPFTIVDGEEWAHVAVNHPFYDTYVYVGWISAGSSDAPFIAPFDASVCPGAEDGYLVETPLLYGLMVLPCFGSRPLMIEGEMRAASIGATACQPEDWLRCLTVYLPSVNGLDLHVDPFAGLEMPPPESQVTVTGHFDDPRSQACGAPDLTEGERMAAILRCRTSFVVDEAVSPPLPRFRLGTPAPVVEFVGAETYDDGQWTRYRLRIANWDEYPTDMLAAAPDLEGCGAIEVAARTWVTIHAANGTETELFCAPEGSEHPAWLSFARRTGEDPPPEVYVEMFDRVEEVVYRSEPVPLTP